MKSHRDRLKEYEYQKLILSITHKDPKVLEEKLKELAKKLKV